MTKFLDFLEHFHILFIIVSLILIFALIGYFVEKKRHKGSPFKLAAERNKVEEINTGDLGAIDTSVSLNAAVSKNAEYKNDANNSTPQL